MTTMPFVMDNSHQGYDIFSRLLCDRIIMLTSEIDDTVAGIVTAQLLYLESQSSTQDISLYINSPGGIVTAGLAIYDTMNHIRCDVSTIGMGQCASMGAFLLSAGTHGKRYALPNCEVMLHQPSGGRSGQASDLEIHARQILHVKERLNTLLAAHTGKPLEVIEAQTDRDRYLTAKEALEYGIVDKIIA